MLDLVGRKRVLFSGWVLFKRKFGSCVITFLMEEILTQGESCQLSNWKIGESLALGIEMARWHNNSITSTLPETNIAMENPPF